MNCLYKYRAEAAFVRYGLPGILEAVEGRCSLAILCIEMTLFKPTKTSCEVKDFALYKDSSLQAGYDTLSAGYYVFF